MTAPDPFRALDGVEPTDRWDDILDRADRPSAATPDDLAARRPRHRRPVLVAAAVLLVLGLAAVVATARGGDSQQEEVHAGPTATDDPAAFWNRTWRVQRITVHGEDRAFAPPLEGPLALHALDPGQVVVVGCASVRSQVHLDGDVLRPDQVPDASDAIPCAEKDGVDLMAQDALFSDLLRDAPTVAVQGDDLVLTAGDTQVELVDATAFDDPTDIWGRSFDVTALVPDGEPVDLARRDEPIRLAFDDAGVGLHECGDSYVGLRIDADALLAVPERDRSMMIRCDGTDDAVSVDAFFQHLPVMVGLRGAHLVLQAGTTRLEATAVAAETTTTTAAPVASPTTEPGATLGASTTTEPATTSTVPTTTVPSTVPTTATTDGPPVTMGAGEGPGALFGHRWRVTAVDGGAGDRNLVGAVIDASTADQVLVAGCNGAGGPVRVEGDHLVRDGGWTHTARGCASTDPDQPDLMARDDFFGSFLGAGPEVVVTGAIATLSADGHRVVAQRV